MFLRLIRTATVAEQEWTVNDMAEYIEKEEAVHLLMSRGRYLTKDLVMDAAYEVSKIPAADVVPVVRGRWKERFNMVGRLVWDCSECDTTSLEHGLYCPYCGARMKDGE